MSVSVTIDHVEKYFGDFHALQDVNIRIEPGELFFLLGPSGCGKTTLLRCIAGFHAPESGRIRMGEEDITNLPPYKRDTGMMFQSYALWPHMTLEQNVAFGLEMRKLPRAEIRERVRIALDHVHLADRAKSRPNQLSGGQQQRVALARALVIDPKCLLLDEPLSNLDAKLRLEMRQEIRRICKQQELTAIYVTHDQKEALSIADRLAVMKSGVVQQVGSPAEVYRNPVNRFVAGFIGECNFLEGAVESRGEAGARIKTPYGTFSTARCPDELPPGSFVTLGIRPESVRFDTPSAEGANVLTGTALETVYLGEVAQRVIRLPSSEKNVEPFQLKASELNPLVAGIPGESVRVWVAPDQVMVLR